MSRLRKPKEDDGCRSDRHHFIVSLDEKFKVCTQCGVVEPNDIRTVRK